MTTPKTAEAGLPVYLYNGLFAGRYRCATPRCPQSLSILTRDEGHTTCHSCRSGAVLTINLDEVEYQGEPMRTERSRTTPMADGNPRSRQCIRCGAEAGKPCRYPSGYPFSKGHSER